MAVAPFSKLLPSLMEQAKGFVLNPGGVNLILTREQLAVKIWGFENEAEYNNVEVYMSFTRKKLSFIGAKTKIKAVRGIGYELRWDNV